MIEITPFDKNAKKHPDTQLKAIALSLQRFGWQQPIKIGIGNKIIVGHGRYLAWQKHGVEMGISEPWIVDENGTTVQGCASTRKLTVAEEKAYRLADNKLNESDWEMDLVLEELGLLKDLDADLIPITGFDTDLLIEPNEADDEMPATPAEAISKLGDLYELGKHRVLCGDAKNIEQVLNLINGTKVDMFLTDPPYNVSYEGKTKDSLKIQNDSMEDGDFRTFLKDAFTASNEAMKAGAVFYIWHADLEGYNFRGGCHDIGWKVRQCLIWNKQSMVLGRQDYHWKHEPCLYGWKEGASHLWNSDRTQTTVLNFARPSRSAEHPTMKPVELFAYLIINNTKGEDIILDTFLGSGTTLIAAEKTGRICYGMELDPKYVDVIVARYIKYTGNTDIRRNGEPIDASLFDVKE